MQNELRRTLNQLRHVPRALGLVWMASGYWSVLWVLLIVFAGLLPAGAVYCSRILVDNLAGVLILGTWESLKPLLLPALAIAAIYLLNLVIGELLNWISVAQAELVSDNLARLIHAKSSDVDLAFYETPVFHDHLHRARSDALYLPLDLLESIGDLLGSTVTLVAMSALLLPYGLWLPAALILSMLPALFVVLQNHRTLHQWWEESTPDQRWARYYDMMLTDESTAAEVRLFRLSPHFLESYQTVRAKLRAGRLKHRSSSSIDSILCRRICPHDFSHCGCVGALASGAGVVLLR